MNPYIAHLVAIISKFHLSYMRYVDDAQLIHRLDGNSDEARLHFHSGLPAVADWMASNCLKIISDKTEVIAIHLDL